MIRKKYRVLITSDKLKTPNCGLGRVAIDFNRFIVPAVKEEMDLTFLTADSESARFLNGQKVEQLTFAKRYIPFYLKKYDLVHVTYQDPSYHVAGAKKMVLTIHDLNFLFTKKPSKQQKYLKRVQRNVSKADAVVFISNFTKEICLKHLSIPASTITRVIYNGVELPNSAPKQPSWLDDNSSYFFAIGQFLEKKNFHVLLPFVKLVPDVKLVIAGDNQTKYGAWLKQQVVKEGLSDRVIFPGQIDEAEKLYLYRGCKAFFVPSIAEGFGLPVIEAMQAGRPVFCSDQTSLAEVGSTYAFYWQSFDPEKMLETYSAGMSSFDEKFRDDAIRYSQQFTWSKNAEAYAQLYHEILERGHS